MQLTEEIHTTFNPDSGTLDTHLESCLQEHRVKAISDETFIRQVVFGMARYNLMLNAVMKALFHYCGGVVLRKDRPTYRYESHPWCNLSGWLNSGSCMVLTNTGTNLLVTLFLSK
jgi:hypothetical protein